MTTTNKQTAAAKKPGTRAKWRYHAPNIIVATINNRECTIETTKRDYFISHVSGIYVGMNQSPATAKARVRANSPEGFFAPVDEPGRR